jgi:hypothetical protein
MSQIRKSRTEPPASKMADDKMKDDKMKDDKMEEQKN